MCTKKNKIPDSDFVHLLGEDEMNRLNTIRIEKHIMQNPNACFCPSINCGKALYSSTNNKWVKKVTCESHVMTAVVNLCVSDANLNGNLDIFVSDKGYL